MLVTLRKSRGRMRVPARGRDRGRISALVLVGLFVAAACSAGGSSSAASGSAGTPPSMMPSFIVGSATPVVGSPEVASLAPALLPSPSPSPAPLTKAELAAAYLKVASTYNAAVDKAWAAYKKTSGAFTYAKRYDAAEAKAELAFIKTLPTIAWPPEYQPTVQRLLTCCNQTYVYDMAASKAKTSADEIRIANQAEDNGLKCSAISNKLRLSLGLPPVPIT